MTKAVDTGIHRSSPRLVVPAAVVVALAGLLAVLVPSVAVGQAAGELDWMQIGDDIGGEAPDDSSGRSVAISSDGTRIAIGAPFNASSGLGSGHVRVHDFDGARWVQVGGDIDGEEPGDSSGRSVAISSDGTRLAIGAPFNDGNGERAGQVRVFDFDGTNWNQTGPNIDGEAPGDESGQSVAMSSDGTRIAIGAPLNDNNGARTGQVRVFDFDGTNWNQTGTNINGEAPGDESGKSLAISSDGTRIAIGAPLSDNNGARAGHVRIYDYDGTNWNQTGTDISGEAAGDESGQSLAISSDGTRIAIGAPFNHGNGARTGHVRVFDFDGTNWNQTGTDINGEAGKDYSGKSVAMSNDGTRIAIGAHLNDNNGARAGHVRIYDYNGTNWTQTGTDINGQAQDDRSGTVAMSSDGTRVAVGARYNDNNGIDSGHVRAFELQVEGPGGSDFESGDVVVLQNVGSGRYLDGDGVQRAWNVDTSPEAKWDAGWRLGSTGEDSWWLRNRRRSRYLDADGGFLGWNVGQSVDIANDDRWQILDNGDGTYLLHNNQYGRYLAQAGTDNKNVITVTEADITNLARWEIAIAS